MTNGAALSCPSCKRALREEGWRDAQSGFCWFCQTPFEAVTFPALTKMRLFAKPQMAVLAEDSTCFFHAQNQAEKVCEGCGRFLCSVCAVPFGGGLLCPACIAAQKTKSTASIPSRMLFDSIVLSLSLAPLLVWPFTILTAPLALILMIYGWNKPASLVQGRRRWKLVVGGVIALIELGVWCFFLAKLWLR